MMLAGWGRYPRHESDLFEMRAPGEIPALVRSADTVIARGAGRSYGDAAIGIGATLSLRSLDRMIGFDPQSGELRIEAGVMLSDIVRTFLPRGFFPPVVPGTQYVTVGGMVAANVHGKNHHRAGAFGRHVISLSLLTADGSEVLCSRHDNPGLFFATIGGMGLTGIIREVTFRMMPVETAFICGETLALPDLDATMRAFEHSRDWTYSVAWIDALAQGPSLGRSLLFRGEHVRRDEIDGMKNDKEKAWDARHRHRVPFELPASPVNRLTVRAFNRLYYWRGACGRKSRIVHLEPYFFPLDSISDWNRLYGPRGFLQHQSIFPKANSRDAIGTMLEYVARSARPPSLAVLKLMGPGDESPMGFPMEGYTLALDFPVNAGTLKLVEILDGIVLAHGGRLYLAKDARQEREVMEAGYPHVGAFRALRKATGAAAKFRSCQSERLGL